MFGACEMQYIYWEEEVRLFAFHCQQRLCASADNVDFWRLFSLLVDVLFVCVSVCVAE